MFQSRSGAESFTTILGTAASGTILSSDPTTPTLHDWTADATGLYHTGSDLGAEWKSYYQTMLAGRGASLTDIQRLEGNAEAVFENTGLAKLDAGALARDREDVQRQFDAMAAALKLAGVDASKPLTEVGYIQMEQALQSNASLEELAMQGHGLNNSGIARYSAYTNDIQTGVDTTTRYVGGGLVDQNGLALRDFLDDVVLSHAPFAVVWRDGGLVQLNQNGEPEDSLGGAVVALNDSMYYRVYTSADFSSHGPTPATDKASNAAFYTAQDQRLLNAVNAAFAAPASADHVKTLYGFEIANTITFNAGNGVTHVWTADANGEFQTSTNLAAEWKSAYASLLKGGKGLTVEQRMEANAEAFFENTGLSKLSAAQLAVDRADVQRQLDAEFMAMRADGVDPSATLTLADYMRVSQTMNFNATINELALQGHGLAKPSASRYAGFTNDVVNALADTTVMDNASALNHRPALADAFNDVLGLAPFPIAVSNGNVFQYNQNGYRESLVAAAVTLQNYVMHSAIFTANNFKAV